MELTARELLTADRLQLKLSATIVGRVTDPRRFLTAAQSVDGRGQIGPATPDAVARDARLVLRAIAASRTLDVLLSGRAEADAELMAALAGAGARYGFRVERAVLRDVILAPEIRRAFTEAERVRRETLASLERARGEQAALRSLSSVARMLKNSPQLMNLRVPQTVEGTDPRKKLKILLGEGVIAPVGTGPGEAED